MNLIFREKWCIDFDKGTIRNTISGLYLRRVTVKPKSTKLGLTPNAVEDEWNILKRNANENVYSFITKLPVHLSSKFTITARINESGQGELIQDPYSETNSGQLFYLNKN